MSRNSRIFFRFHLDQNRNFWYEINQFLNVTTFKIEQKHLLSSLLNVEDLLAGFGSDDFGRYTEMGLHIDPNYPDFLSRNGDLIKNVKVFCNY